MPGVLIPGVSVGSIPGFSGEEILGVKETRQSMIQP